MKSISRLFAVAAISLFATAASQAHASVALLLEQPYGGLGHVNPTGHSALYFDHVCAASPVQLRPCEPGELGVVISRYDGIGGYDWIAVPLLPYLYAVESPADIPQTVDRVQEAALRDLYRRHALESVAPDLPDGGTPEGNWYELAGSAYDRTIYGFSVNTTPEQDAKIIARLNDRRNVESYNGAFRNCADFARVTINQLYPHAIRRNFVADLGLTTPKQVARGLSRYASHHPQVGLRYFVIPQVKGSLPRSHPAQGVTESLIKRYGVPLAVLSPVATGVVFLAYLGHGRFDMPQNAPVLDLRQQEHMAASASHPQAEIPAGRQAASAESDAAYAWPLLAAPAPSGAFGASVPGLLSSPGPADLLPSPSSD